MTAAPVSRPAGPTPPGAPAHWHSMPWPAQQAWHTRQRQAAARAQLAGEQPAPSGPGGQSARSRTGTARRADVIAAASRVRDGADPAQIVEELGITASAVLLALQRSGAEDLVPAFRPLVADQRRSERHAARRASRSREQLLAAIAADPGGDPGALAASAGLTTAAAWACLKRAIAAGLTTSVHEDAEPRFRTARHAEDRAQYLERTSPPRGRYMPRDVIIAEIEKRPGDPPADIVRDLGVTAVAVVAALRRGRREDLAGPFMDLRNADQRVARAARSPAVDRPVDPP